MRDYHVWPEGVYRVQSMHVKEAGDMFCRVSFFTSHIRTRHYLIVIMRIVNMALALSILATSQANMQDFRLFQRQTWCPAESTAGPITTHKCADGYCVYTDARFWGGRGISFLTTADAMDKTVRRGLEQHYRPGFVTKVAVDAFEEREVAGKGVGLVAKRLLRRGELIIAEPPSVMVHLDMRTSVSEETRLEMQRAAVDALPRGTRLETLGLAGRGRGDAVEDILDTNSFTVTLAKAWDHHALFTQTSVSSCCWPLNPLT